MIDEGRAEIVDEEDDEEGGANSEEDDLDIDDVVEARGDGSTYGEAINADIDLIAEFVKGLRHQVQFHDQRMLSALEREGAGFLQLGRACMEKEKRLQSTRGGETPSTWEKSTISAMFYRIRPTNAEMNT